MGDRQKVPSADAIKAVLARHMRLTALDIKVETRGGTVFLRGVVELLAEKLHAEEVVKYLKGVQRVENELTVAPMKLLAKSTWKRKSGDCSGRRHAWPASASAYSRASFTWRKVESPADEDLARHLAARVRGVKDVQPPGDGGRRYHRRCRHH